MIDFSWSFYFQIISIILIVYYICVYIFLRRLKKKMSGFENSVSKSELSPIDESEFESETDQETFVKQISIVDLIANKLTPDNSPERPEDMTPESDIETPDDVIETPSDPIEDIPAPDEPYLDFIDPEIPTPTIPEMDNMDTESEDSIDIYEPVDISIEENEETYIIDGAVIEDFKEEFCSSESPFKKKIQSFDEIMQANPELQKAMLQN